MFIVQNYKLLSFYINQIKKCNNFCLKKVRTFVFGVNATVRRSKSFDNPMFDRKINKTWSKIVKLYLFKYIKLFLSILDVFFPNFHPKCLNQIN